MKRIRYNRADINSTMAAAQNIAQTKTCYVFATACGFVIENQPAPFNNRCYKVMATGVEKIGQW